MTKIKLCGLSRLCDVVAVNALKPDYVGFVFWEKSRRNVSPASAKELKKLLSPAIQAVGVFVNEPPENVASLLSEGIIDAAQLHGDEDEGYLAKLRQLTDAPVIQAFRVKSAEDIARAESSAADYVLLDAGMGEGAAFDWSLLKDVTRPYFLAGGLNPANAADAVTALRPFAVDVSSGIETDGRKDAAKMAAFVNAVRAASD